MPDRFSEDSPADLMRRYRMARERAAEPFYSTEPPCIDCGRPLSECACNIADEPICLALYPRLMAAKTIREFREIHEAHKLICQACGGRKVAATERTTRKKAA